MILKIYLSLWTIWAAAIGVLFLSGSLLSFTTVFFGFLGVGLGFMGMISLLPTMNAHGEDI